MRRTISITLVRVGHDGRMVANDNSERAKSVYGFSMGLSTTECVSAVQQRIQEGLRRHLSVWTRRRTFPAGLDDGVSETLNDRRRQRKNTRQRR